ncbi:flagellar hook-basal body complex protein [Abyssibius alkaniclasticus]|uniref:flagellar hook-basal body complex protein n=1 Tax=Abyssibius alkaniclasticus TaxID=2881234 RepID=UPI00236322AC|nr:flagellar hook-basal body complex protein [Abyssibius alkaniclasticus]UPH71830.1 flagellar hook-basal body complex protein [Abyssibius alkaniclasticus]
MDNTGYVALTRQVGLLREMQLVANNIANASTTGFRREGVLFAEVIAALPVEGGNLSMADARVRYTDRAQGVLRETGNPLDMAIEGPGFFSVETPDGTALTRAGAFSLNAQSELVTMDGLRVLDDGGAPIFIPPDAARVSVATDGTISADNRPLARFGLVTPEDPAALNRRDGVLFVYDGPLSPVEAPSLRQGFVEGSNVSAVSEITRMIEVQRSYELGQKLLDQEHERISGVTRTLGQRA